MGAGHRADDHQRKAVIEALMGTRAAFARTPKYRVVSKTGRGASRRRSIASAWADSVDRVAGGRLFRADGLVRHVNENYFTVPFLILFVFGYWYTGMMSLMQGRFDAFGQAARGGAQRQAVSGGGVGGSG